MISLKAVQAFAAIVRHGSVVQAATELGVTGSALSHLLRELEGRLGTPLFERVGRGLVPTEDGRRLADAVVPAFAQIDRALADFGRRRIELRISTLSTFASSWLIPRLARFQARHPDIELLVATSTRNVDFERESFDCAIRHGQGNWANVQVKKLYDDSLVPAVSPQLAAETGLQTPADLAKLRLLHGRARRGDWAVWLEQAGVHGIDTSHGPVFETRAQVVQAAIGRLGAMVIDPWLIADEIRQGHLVIPFGPVVPLPAAYWLVWPQRRANARPLSVFRDWLDEEITTEMAPLGVNR
ncbi:MAG TPA: LysR substrate-binding domain-containing protein [Geminicoccus sp.]|jgi:DNA-binding transcriptional LysR family regulator|uniref:LysR substrate-binding domain-containing protein n=1 Tax=Geminicoccus sp. TaxID=2024832 RepID=UPI002E37B39C|nr:LysR substrate-binding domain-containing protein [Geminicoccus sp.]HEX2529224.1 LysR substrate-binding domain-containing protein [Geminicoccus sp.]